jgi:hypothetical protein
MAGLGDTMSSLAHRTHAATPAGASSTPHSVAPSQRSAASLRQARAEQIVANFNPATDLNLVGRGQSRQIANKTAAYLQNKFAALMPPTKAVTAAPALTAAAGPAPLSPAAVANALRTAFTPGAAASVAPPPAVQQTTSALTTTPTPAITPSSGAGGGGGGGGGTDSSTPDTTDMTTADAAPTGWAALSPTMKVAVVGGAAVVAYIGYRAMRHH